MSEENTNAKAQMRKGVLEYCSLLVLARGDAYASDILARLKDADLLVMEGTLYPLLTRLKNAGWLTYRWEESTQGPPRKYYSLTDNGKLILQALDRSWDELITSVGALRDNGINLS